MDTASTMSIANDDVFHSKPMHAPDNHNYLDVLKALEEFNRSQADKIASIDSDTTCGDTVECVNPSPQSSERSEQAKKLRKYPIYHEWVQTLIAYNNELVQLIESNQRSQRPIADGSDAKVNEDRLIDFGDSEDDNEHCENEQSNIATPDSEQNNHFIADDPKQLNQIDILELEGDLSVEAAVDARVLVLELAEKHDEIAKLKHSIGEMESALQLRDTQIQQNLQLIEDLRKKLCTPPAINKTDASADAHNQTDESPDETFTTYMDLGAQIKLQQTELEQLNVELAKSKSNYESLSDAYESLEEQLQFIKSAKEDHFQTEKALDQTPSEACVEDLSTTIADKTNLANLITSLKSELAAANALLKVKETECNEFRNQLTRSTTQSTDAKKRFTSLEKQCENYRETIKHLEQNLSTHSDTIKILEETQSLLKTQMESESQEKQKELQKLLDDNKKLESDVNFHTTAHSSSPPATVSTCSNNVSSNCFCQQHYREDSVDILSENLQTYFQENIKLSKMITLLRDENVELRERIIDTETDYVILNESYKNFITITFQYENDLLEELASKSIDCADCVPTASNGRLDKAVVNGIQEKLFRMEVDYAKRLKIQEICYKKKINDLQAEIKQMDPKQIPAIDDESAESRPRSTLKDLIAEIHQLQQNVREKEMLIRRNEISFKFKNDNFTEKITRLEKLLENEKRLCGNLSAENRELKDELALPKAATASADQIKLLNELQLQKDEFVGRLEKQNDEIQRLNSKFKDVTTINTQLNDELNEKTEQICQLHSENSRLTVEITKLLNEMKNGQENESHLSVQLSNERKNIDTKAKSLMKCEALVKQFADKNDELSREATTLHESLIEIKGHLNDSQKREDVLNQDLRSVTELLKETQHHLRNSNERIHQLSMYQQKFTDLKKMHDQLLLEISMKGESMNKTEENLNKLQSSYDLLLNDFNDLMDIKDKAESTLKLAGDWQEEQKQREELMNKKIAMQTEHISTLLDDRHALIAKNNEMLRDMLILRKKLETYKNILPNTYDSPISPTTPMYRYSSDPQINNFEEYQRKLDYSIERMTRNLQRTRTFWESGINKVIQNDEN